MGRHAKVSNKHYCEVCKIWIENHPINIKSHQEGGRHRYNLRTQLKGESLREAQKRSREEEIRREFQKLQGASEETTSKRKTPRVAAPPRNVWAHREAPIPNKGVNLSLETFEEESHDEDRGVGKVGEWEEVEESESVFRDTLPESPNKNPFVQQGSCVQVVRGGFSRSAIRPIRFTLSEEGASDQFFQTKKEICDEEEASKVESKIEFRSRKAPTKQHEGPYIRP